MTLIALACLTWACEKPNGENKTAAKDEKNSEKAAANKDDGKKSAGRGGRSRGPITVRVATAERRISPRVITAVAPLTGRTQADVYAKVVGRLAWVGAREGQVVKANETLFRVDRSDPGESFLSVPVVSPISGWVGRWYLQNVGEQVTTTAPVVTIVNDENLRALVHLSTTDWVAVDQRAKVVVEIANESRPAKIVSVARAADGTSSRGSVIVEVDNKNHKWRAGMVARVRLELEPKERILMPSTALTVTDRGAFVFVVEGDKANRQEIQYRLVDADTVEVLSGLPDKFNVVIAGGNLLTNGATVKTISSESGAPAAGTGSPDAVGAGG